MNVDSIGQCVLVVLQRTLVSLLESAAVSIGAAKTLWIVGLRHAALLYETPICDSIESCR
jgi:hypothetical protein